MVLLQNVALPDGTLKVQIISVILYLYLSYQFKPIIGKTKDFRPKIICIREGLCIWKKKLLLPIMSHTVA